MRVLVLQCSPKRNLLDASMCSRDTRCGNYEDYEPLVLPRASSTVSQHTLREYSKRRLEILRQLLGRQNRQVDLSFPSVGVHCREALVPAGVLVVSDAIVASAFEVRAWQRG